MSQERAAILSQMRTVAARAAQGRRNVRNSQDAGYIAIVNRSLAMDAKELDKLKARLADWPK